jgi:hypothetical protein
MLLTREAAPPMALLLLPLMIAGMMQALQGGQIEPMLWALALIAVLVAPVIALFQLQARIVEIEVTPPLVGLRTAWEVAKGAQTPFSQIGNLRADASGVYFAWSRQAVELTASDWRDPLLVRKALAEAHHA